MKYKMLVVVMGAVLLCSGCDMERTSVLAQSEGERQPHFETSDNIEYDWDQAQSDCYDMLPTDDYPLLSDVGALDSAVHEDTKTVQIIISLKSEASEEDAIAYATAYIKAYNDVMHDQDFSIGLSTNDSYGSFWDEYSIEVQAYREGDILDESKYLIYKIIAAGSNEPLTAGIDEEATTAAVGAVEIETEEAE